MALCGKLISDKSQAKELIWEIENCLDRYESIKCIYLPKFSFALSMWRMHIYPFQLLQKENWISIELLRQDGEDSELIVEFKFEIRDYEGTSLKIVRGVRGFAPGGSFVTAILLPRDILGNKEVFGIKGVLTVICGLRLKSNYGAEACTQTKPLSRSTDELVLDFKRLLRFAERSDISFKVQESEFKAHGPTLLVRHFMFYLKCHNQTARRMKTSPEVPRDSPLNIENCEPDTFEQFLQYLYTGAISYMTFDEATRLYVFTPWNFSEGLREKCAALLENFLSVETVCAILTVALQRGDEKLTDLAENFFLEKRDQITITQELKDFFKENPERARKFFEKVFHKKFRNFPLPGPAPSSVPKGCSCEKF